MSELELKKKYNEALMNQRKIEDGSFSITKVPIYQRINNELKHYATEIAKLHGVKGGLLEVLDHFQNGELIKGFNLQ